MDELIMNKIIGGREYRDIKPDEIRAKAEDEQDQVVEGYATTFNEQYTLFADGSYIVREQVSPDAFKETDMSDVVMQYDHQGRVFARLSNKTLELDVDDHGLKIRAKLGGTEIGRQLYEEIKGGYTNKMSFGFTVSEDSWEYIEDHEHNQTTAIRTILKIGKLYDVSAVSLPANDGTEISARNVSDGAIARIKAECLAREAEEKRRKELITLIELELELSK